MITLRRVRVAVLAVPVLLAGCSSDGDAGQGGSPFASGSPSLPTAGTPDTVSVPTSSGPSSGPSATSSSSRGGGVSAEFDDLTGLTTTLAFDRSFVSALGALKVVAAPVGNARASGSSIAFPITGGEATVGNGTVSDAEIEHENSGLTLTAGGTTLQVTDLVLRLGGSGTFVTATVGRKGGVPTIGTRVLDLDPSDATTTGSSAAVAVSGVKARLATEFVAVAGKAFGTSALRAGTPVAELTLALTGR